MLEEKVQDLRLRGCGFTLYPAAEENGVTGELMHSLVTTMYCKLGLNSGNFETEEKIKEENPNIPDRISKADFDKYCYGEDYQAEALISAGLVEASGDELVLTTKASSIIKRASDIQKELDQKGFHFCPCHATC